jgi:hypothetical protein
VSSACAESSFSSRGSCSSGNPEGNWNVERLKLIAAVLDALDGASVSISRGTLVYTDRGLNQGFEAVDCDLVVRGIRLTSGVGPQFWQRFAVEGELTCAEIRTHDFIVTGTVWTVAEMSNDQELADAVRAEQNRMKSP